MRKSRSLRNKTKRKRQKRVKTNKRRSLISRKHRRHRRRQTKRIRRNKIVQRGGSGLGQALYNAAFVGSGPPFGVDPKSKAAQSCPGGGCDAAHYCNTQPNSGGSSKATPGMTLGTLCQNGAALLGQAEPPPGSPFDAMKKFKQDTSVP